MPSRDPKDKLGDVKERRKENSKDRNGVGAFMGKNRKLNRKMEQK
jgi:hypothetical protein